MIPVVVIGPAQVVTAADAKAVKVFASDDEDSYIAALLAVAQSQIDGWNGWLGRAIGLQTLEVELAASLDWSPHCLPLPPYVDTISEVIADGIRTVRYRAGYGASPALPLPAAIKHAIILMAGTLRDAAPSDEGALKRETIDGVGSFDYALPDGAADAMQKAAQNLLAPYRVYRL